MLFKTSSEVQEIIISQAFTDLLDSGSEIKIFTQDGNCSLINRDLMRFSSPLVNSILNGVPCCTSSMIFLPDVSQSAVDHVLSIIFGGFSDFNSVSMKQIKDVQDAAKMLQIDLTDLDYIDKRSLSTQSNAATQEKVPLKECHVLVAEKNVSSFDKHTNKDDISVLKKVMSPCKDKETNLGKIDSIQEDLSYYPLNELVINQDTDPVPRITKVEAKKNPEDNQTHRKIKKEVLENIDSVEYSEILNGNDFLLQNVKREQNPKMKNLGNLESGIKIESSETKSMIKKESECNIKSEILNSNLSVKKEPKVDYFPDLQLYPFLAPTPPPETDQFSPPPKVKKIGRKFIPSETKDLSVSKNTRNVLVKQTPPAIQGQELMESNDKTNEKLESIIKQETDKYNAFDHRTKVTKSKPLDLSTNTDTVCKSPEIPKLKKDDLKNNSLILFSLSHQNDPGPPRSSKSEVQHVHKTFYHQKCGETHNTVDLCREAPVHILCGTQHSYFKECDGSWMSLPKFEGVAMSLSPNICSTPTAISTPTEVFSIPTISVPTVDPGFPFSRKPELEYVYEMTLHGKCCTIHRRVDVCPAANVHIKCGKNHSYAKECSGAWLKLETFEAMAMNWPSTRIRMQPDEGNVKNVQKRQKRLSDEINTKDIEVARRKRVRYEERVEKVEHKPYKEMTEEEKMINTCAEWNQGKCMYCNYWDRKRHRCSKMVSAGKQGERICWGNHKEVDHGESHRCTKLVSDAKMGERICWGDHKEAEHDSNLGDQERNKRTRLTSSGKEGERRGIKERLH